VISGKAVNTLFNIIDLERISYIQPDVVRMVFNHNQLAVQVPDAKVLAETILWLHRVVTFKMEELQSVVKVESTPEKAVTYPTFSVRQPHSLQLRMFTLGHHHNTKIPLTVPETVAEWDGRPQTVFKIPSDFQCGDGTRAIAHAIAWDSEVKSLVLAGVAAGTLNLFLQTLLSHSPFLTRVSLDDYVDPPKVEFDFGGRDRSKLSALSFRNCNTALLFAVLRGFGQFKGRIQTLTISKCKLMQDHFTALYKLIGTLPAFMGLTSLRLEEGSTDGIDLQQFGEFLSAPKLKYLSIGKSELDASNILSAIAPKLASVRSLFITNGRLLDTVQPGVVFSSSMVYLDISKTSVYPVSLGAFIRELVTKPRRQLLTLVLSDLITSTSSEQLMTAFDVRDGQPVLAELNYSGNELSPGSIAKLIEFLRTQKHVQYLCLSRCFRDHADSSLAVLAEYIVDARLQGLEINSDPSFPLGAALPRFLQRLTGRSMLYTLVCERTACGDAGLEAMRLFVESNPKLTALSCDGAAPTSAATFNRAYASFARIERLVAPRADAAQFGNL
jgi:hypothetical protein